MGQHWKTNSHQIGANQPAHQLEEARQKGNGARTPSRPENIVT